MKEFYVSADDAGLRLDQWCKKYVPEMSFALMQKLIRKGAIRVNKTKVTAKERLEEGQQILISDKLFGILDQGQPASAPRQLSTNEQQQALRQMVIHEDKDCFVLNKPAGLAVQGGSGIKDSVDSRLDALASPSGERPKLVHRLDKDTSGVLVIAKSRRSAALLTNAFHEKTTRKSYWALVVGVPERPLGTIELPLGKRGSAKGEKMTVIVDEADGQYALTHYRLIEPIGRALSWLELYPVTGRTHQLRVHLSAIGHPVVGDGKYGGRFAFPTHVTLDEQLHLHARQLVIDTDDIHLDVSAPLDEHMKRSWKTLRLPREDQGVSLLEML